MIPIERASLLGWLTAEAEYNEQTAKLYTEPVHEQRLHNAAYLREAIRLIEHIRHLEKLRDEHVKEIKALIERQERTA